MLNFSQPAILEEMGRRRKKERKSGGFVFLLSLFFLLILGTLNSFLLIHLFDAVAFSHLLYFSLAFIAGGAIAGLFILGHFSVLIHEYKHSIVSGLAGNKAKRIHVKRSTGYFEYEYTKETAPYNAFIALAPYYLPFFSIPGVLLAFAMSRGDHIGMVVILGIAYGMDTIMNVRDISRHQTDITLINGGYYVGLAYIFAMNLVILTIILAWIFQGLLGLRYLFYGLWELVVHLVDYYRRRGL